MRQSVRDQQGPPGIARRRYTTSASPGRRPIRPAVAVETFSTAVDALYGSGAVGLEAPVAMKFSSTAVGGVENRVRVIHMGGFTETMVFFDLHTHPKIFGLPDRHLVSKRDFGHRAGNF